jgi:hypothetical protein
MNSPLSCLRQASPICLAKVGNGTKVGLDRSYIWVRKTRKGRRRGEQINRFPDSITFKRNVHAQKKGSKNASFF